MKLPKEYTKGPYWQFFKVFRLKNGEDMPLNEDGEILSGTVEGAILEFMRSENGLKAMEIGEWFNKPDASLMELQLLIISVEKDILEKRYADELIEGDAPLINFHLSEHDYHISVTRLNITEFSIKSDPAVEHWYLTKVVGELPDTHLELTCQNGKINMKGEWLIK